MFITGAPILRPSELLKAIISGPVKDARHYAYGRFLIDRVIEAEDLRQSPVYVPAYICDEALEMIRQKGRKIIYYPVRKDLCPDWEWLGKRAKKERGAFLLVHYFGFVNDLGQAIAFCKARNLVLIEDCAHSFLTSWQGRPIGTIGDYGIYSYRKVLPVPDGAELIGKKKPVKAELPGPTVKLTDNMSWMARQLVKYLIFRLGLPFRNSANAAAPQKNGGQLKSSYLTSQIVRLYGKRYTEIKLKRRQNYAYLLKAFDSFPEIRPLFAELPLEVCPWVFPVLISSNETIKNKLWREGIPVSTWPDLPAEVNDNDELRSASWLRQNVLLFPIHQDISREHLERYVAAYKKVRA
jgi:dTDP-4-amino-4,6-dideoxygalactose transaminase